MELIDCEKIHTTGVNPLVGTSDEFLTTEKKFFLTHWSEQFQAEARSARADQAAVTPPEGN